MRFSNDHLLLKNQNYLSDPFRKTILLINILNIAMSRPWDDCKFFLTSVCRNAKCQFRHSEVAKANTEYCTEWAAGLCRDMTCPKKVSLVAIIGKVLIFKKCIQKTFRIESIQVLTLAYTQYTIINCMSIRVCPWWMYKFDVWLQTYLTPWKWRAQEKGWYIFIECLF